MVISRRGVVAVLTANVLFGVIYLYGSFMQPMLGTDVFAWRMVSMLVALTVLMFMLKAWPEAKKFITRMNEKPVQWLLFLLSTAVVAVNFWIFMWGPVNGYGIDVALGYFLLPLTTILMALMVFGEKLNTWQKWAITFAAMGVGHELWVAQSLSWVAMLCCLSYPFYYGIRRYLAVPALVGLWLDLVLIAPVAMVYLLAYSDSFTLLTTQWKFIPLIVSLGMISALAMFGLLYAMRALPITLFSMLTYGEPILLFVLAILFMGAPLTTEAMLTYGMIWLGLSLMMWDSYLQMRKSVGIEVLKTDEKEDSVAVGSN